MPSQKKLAELAAQIGEALPGVWDLFVPPPYWMAVLTRRDQLVRVQVDESLNIAAETSINGSPLPPLGTLPTQASTPSRLFLFKTRLRDGRKIASVLADKLALE